MKGEEGGFVVSMYSMTKLYNTEEYLIMMSQMHQIHQIHILHKHFVKCLKQVILLGTYTQMIPLIPSVIPCLMLDIHLVTLLVISEF